MAITKLLSYTAEVEILGEIKVIEVDAVKRTLTVRDVSMDVSHEILEKLSEGRLRAVVPPKVVEMAETSEPTPINLAGFTVTPLAGVPLTPPQAAPEPPGPAPEPQAAPAVAPRPPAPQRAMPMPVEKPANGEVPDRIMKATKLRDVVVYLLDSGCKTTAEILTECEKLKSRIELLARMNNLEERVKRQLVGLEGSPSI